MTQYHFITLSNSGITARISYSRIPDISPEEIDKLFDHEKNDMTAKVIPARPRLHSVELLLTSYEPVATKLPAEEVLKLAKAIQEFAESRLEPLSGEDYYG
jgi:hypothetical protein